MRMKNQWMRNMMYEEYDSNAGNNNEEIEKQIEEQRIKAITEHKNNKR